jgi:hypothetical protein
MTLVKVQIPKFQAEKFCLFGFSVFGGSAHERLLNESRRLYMLAFRIYIIPCQSKSPMDYFGLLKSMARLF